LSVSSALGPYLKAYRRPYLVGAACSALSVGFLVIHPRLVQMAVDSLETSPDSRFLLRCAAGIVLVTLVRAFFLFLTRHYIIVSSRRIENDIRNDFYRSLQTFSPGFYHRNPTGDLMAVATNDLNAVRALLGPGIMYSINTFFRSILIIVNLVLISPRLTLVALAVLPVMAVAVYRFGKAIHWRFLLIQEQFGTVTTRAQENLAGARVIRSYRREEHERELFAEVNREYVRRNRGHVIVQSAFRPALSAIVGVGTMLMILVGGGLIIKENAAPGTGITLGEFTAFAIYLTMLVWPAVAIGWVTGLFQRGAASMKRIMRVMETEPIIRDDPAARPLDPPKQTMGEKKGRGIEIRDLSFRYAPDAPLVLRNVSIIVEPGTSLALIGPTGSGKTTLISLLARLYPVERGRILIDNRDINDITIESMRALYGFVTQETFLFSDTIGNNIAFSDPEKGAGVTRGDRISRAAGIAAIDSEIEELPDGFDTMLGEKGINLSGGQKQRTAIARAIVKDPEILVFDDALSSVDTRTEAKILRGLREIEANRTTILISHRISTIRHADQILVLRNGAVTERGTHQELVRQGGLYAALNEQQRLKSEIEEL